MNNVFGKSWLTTILGLIGAILEVILPLLQSGSVDSANLARAATWAAIGFATKSFNVTGTDKK